MKIFLFGLLILAFLGFSADLFHMTYHLSQDSSLWQVSGVPFKYAVKVFFVLMPILFFIRRKSWQRLFLILVIFIICAPSSSFAFWSSGCKQARHMLKDSGTARDAKENFFGRIKVQPPHGSFPQEMDQITWWGKFKPFEFWQSPKFQATWIDPEGKEVMRKEFKGEHCALAKSSMNGEEQPQGMFKPGVWKVIVTCEDYLIDRQTFAVVPTNNITPVSDENQKMNQEPLMIWAKDKV